MNNNNNNSLLHLYSAFPGIQIWNIWKGESPQPSPVCSIHLDDATAAILRQNTHHTAAHWWRRDQSVYGDDWKAMMDRGQWANLARLNP